MSSSAVIALGIGQCVNWGVLYYAFAILVVPIERELAVPTWIVTGAFSLALLVSAIAAPAIGRSADRDRGTWLIQGGGIAAAALLVVWASIPGVLTTYVVWAALGLCMSAALYEPAFIVVGRAHDDPALRLRALALVTLFGGLASTIFLPATAVLVDAVGWRGAVLILAGLLLLSAGLTHRFVFRSLRAAPRTVAAARSSSPPFVDGRATSRFQFVAASFALATFASAGFAANLVPALGESGASPATAAMLGGVMGVMQLPGRALLMNGTFAGSPGRLLAASLLLHGAGLGAVALAVSPLAIAVGTMTLALGAGVTTLVRPHLIHTTFSADSAGYLNGRLARAQQLARAAGPLALASLAGAVSYGAVFAVLALMFAGLALASAGVLGDVRKSPLANRS
jgi:MFS family permease